MNPSLPSPLPRGDRKLLRFVCRLVPFNQREEWIRSWVAELWCCHHAHRGVRTRTLFFGVLQDALWLRGEQVRQAVSGTAILCLFALLILISVSCLPALSHYGRWGGLDDWLMRQGSRFSCESVLIAFVSYATAPFQVGSGATRRQVWLKARLFHWAKTFLVLILAFNLSADLSYPLQTFVPLTSEFLQSICLPSWLCWACAGVCRMMSRAAGSVCGLLQHQSVWGDRRITSWNGMEPNSSAATGTVCSVFPSLRRVGAVPARGWRITLPCPLRRQSAVSRSSWAVLGKSDWKRVGWTPGGLRHRRRSPGGREGHHHAGLLCGPKTILKGPDLGSAVHRRRRGWLGRLRDHTFLLRWAREGHEKQEPKQGSVALPVGVAATALACRTICKPELLKQCYRPSPSSSAGRVNAYSLWLPVPTFRCA